MKNTKLHKSKLIKVAIGNLAIVGLLTGCGESELLQMINNGDQIEIEVAVPLNQEQGTESQILWEELASLTTNDVLRKEWDDTLLITKTDTGKNGILYVDAEGKNDNNNTLRVALHNREFVKLFESEDSIIELSEAVQNQYVDIEADETMKPVYMGINGYFNLLPDATPNYCNPDSTLNRLEFMSMVMRAETPVAEVEADSAFATAVGNNDLNLYAQEVADSSYLDIESKSLNNMTANGTMTRAEAVYMLMNRYFSDELANVDISSANLTDCKDGKNIAEQQKFIEDDVAKEYWKSYELVYCIQNPDGGVPTDLYKAMVLAEQKGIIDSETRFDEGITKAEAVELLVNTLMQDPSIEIFNATKGSIDGHEVTDEETEVDKSDLNDIGNEYYEPEEEEVVEETTVETPSDEEGTPYTLTEADKEALRILGATEDEINAVKTEEQFDTLLEILFDRSVGNTGGSSGGSGGSGNSGGDSGSSGDEGDSGLPGFDLGNPEDTLPGSM